ncbi:RND superfamily putative drug exporter [Saccharothrix ecbatanensis]|uniref:RND superfamily putative drug exporter n=1 Tax=Saccharothrix ecbatanensis TaxID=1105145 RepID=A0A7W9M1Q2_9PSEU|nr:MMPL family transporter [Saccharothrix ecbatanensis]MBB5804146.1 RND superfamily putative drug exporter [Saccharothrix ecbatanensis]
MFKLGRFAVRRRRLILIVAAIVAVAAAVVGSGTLAALSLSRFEAPGTESLRAAEVLAEEFDTGNPNLTLLVTARDGDVDDPRNAERGRALAAELAPDVRQVESYWDRESPALKSEDGSQALILAWVPGSATEARKAIAELSERFTRADDVITVGVGGQDEVFRQVGAQAAQDFLRAEIIVIPVVLLLLILLYRRVSLALTTLGVGLFAMVGTLAALRGLTALTEVSTFAANITLVMGLALGVDYCLFVIARYREELAGGSTVPEAVERAVATAGRTVLFSGLTVAASLAMLLLFPFPFLRSFAYAGVLVVGFAVVGALTVLPAALACLKPHPAVERSNGFWARTANTVMNRPLLVGGAVLALLLLLASPVLGLKFGLPDDRILPADASSRIVQDQIRDGFGQEKTDAIRVIAKGAQGDDFAARLGDVPGIVQVDVETNGYGTVWTAIPSQEALAGDVPELVAKVRALQPDYLVGGYPAELADFRDALTDRVPLVVALILIITFVLLFLMTGSILLPLKATVLNLLSLGVMFGVVVWGFQNGNLSGVLDFTPTGTLEPSIPILMFCIAYGLSMDYEVFMVSRIAEEYARTGDERAAVATGIQRSAPLITAAAAILALSFAAYASGSVMYLQMLGAGMAVAIIVDATFVRAVLVPALMRLAGRANWWAPGWLRQVHTRFGISESR